MLPADEQAGRTAGSRPNIPPSPPALQPTPRTILPAAATRVLKEEGSQERPNTAGPSQGVPNLTVSTKGKRSRITPVACQSCQQRKSKCDGARPTCGACALKGRTTCHYDVSSDQRRTDALRLRIRDLEQQLELVRKTLRHVCYAPDKDAAIATAVQLDATGFRDTNQVALAEDGVVLNTDNYVSASHKDITGGSTHASLCEPKPQTESPSSFAIQQYSPYPAIASSVSYPEPAGGNADMGGLDSISGASDRPYLYGMPNYERLAGAVPWESSNFESSNAARGFDLGKRWHYHPVSSHSGQVLYFHDPDEPSPQAGQRVVECRTIRIYGIQPTPKASSNTLSQELMGFVQEKRNLLAQGRPLNEALGQEDLDISVLQEQGSLNVDDLPEPTVAQWLATEFLGLDNVAFQERVALLVTTAKILRWMVMPSRTHYEALLEFLRPTPSQHVVTHEPWIDIIPWPDIRDTLIATPQLAEAEGIFQHLVANMAIDWKFSTDDMIILHDQDHLHVNPSFLHFIADLNNWSLNPIIAEAYPLLAGKACFKPRGL